MTSQQVIISRLGGNETLESLAKKVRPLKPGKFVPLGNSWFYTEPVKLQKQLASYTDESRTLLSLDYFHQHLFYKELEKPFGIKPRHGDLKEDFKAAYLSQDYRQNVLTNHSVFNSMVLNRSTNIDRADVRRVTGARYVDVEVLQKPPGYILLDEHGEKNLPNPTRVPVYELGSILQTEVAPHKGVFDDFDHVPTNKDLKISGIGRGSWGGIYSHDDGLSIIQTGWDPIDGFHAYGTTPFLAWNVVMPIWTSENPRK